MKIKEKLPPLERAFEEIKELAGKSRKIIITSHVNPDGDAIGSELAMYHILKSLRKEVRIINHSPTPENFFFLEGADEILNFSDEKAKMIFNSADTIFIVDLSDPKRIISMTEAVLKSNAAKIVIDHHEEPKEFADCYAVDTNASSTGEIISRMLKSWNIVPDKHTAQALYTAIMTDTGSFRFPRTTPEVHQIIAYLIENGADPVKCYEKVYNRMPLNKAHLLGRAYSSIDTFYGGRLAVMMLKREDFLETESREGDTEDIVEKILVVKGVAAGVMLSDPPDSDTIRMSFRAKGDISIRSLALEFGGGGHEQAAGARSSGKSIDEVKSELVQKARKLFL